MATHNAGSVDPSFGDNGSTKIAFDGLTNIRATSLISQDNGETIACFHCIAPQFTFLKYGITRLKENGQVDLEFGDSGYVSDYMIAEDRVVSPKAIATPDGGILCWSEVRPDNAQQNYAETYALVRLDRSGARDREFGTDGVCIVPKKPFPKKPVPETGIFGVLDVATRANGNIIILAGEYHKLSDSSGAIEKSDTLIETYFIELTPKGKISKAFGQAGFVSITQNIRGVVSAQMIAMKNEKIIVHGKRGPRGMLSRFNADGSIDESFGGEGRGFVYFSTEEGNKPVHLVNVLHNNGSLLCIAEEYNYLTSVGFVAVYNEDGSAKLTFHRGERLYAADGEYDFTWSAGVIDHEGQCLTTGVKCPSGVQESACFLYSKDGSIDDNHLLTTDDVVLLSIQNDSKIVSCQVNNGEWLIARYLSMERNANPK